MQQTPRSKQSAAYIEVGKIKSLCFFISLGRFVNVNASNSAEKTIQNQESVLSIAKLQIKHGMSAIPYEM